MNPVTHELADNSAAVSALTEPELISSQTISSDVAFKAIQEAVFEITDMSVPISPETRMDRYFKDILGSDEIYYAGLSLELEFKLGAKVSNDDWVYLSGRTPGMSSEEWEVRYAELFTFGRLADLVALRARIGAVRPLTILGATSVSAGAFRRIEEIVLNTDPNIESFGPSTKILDRLRRRTLRQVWAKLRLLSRNRIPVLRTTWSEIVAESLFGTRGVLLVLILTFVGFVIIGRVTGLTTNISWAHWIALLILWGNSIAGAIAVSAFVSAVLLRRHGNNNDAGKLPKGIKTFRDLAELISGDRGGWCTKCDYDLTGLTSGICPECGTPINPNPLQWAKSEPKT